jgi:hypothetical protein
MSDLPLVSFILFVPFFLDTYTAKNDRAGNAPTTYNNNVASRHSQSARRDERSPEQLRPLVLHRPLRNLRTRHLPGSLAHGYNLSPDDADTYRPTLAALAMVISAIKQHFIYHASFCDWHALQCVANPADKKLPVWIQIPVYVLIANSAVLALILGIEYAYSNAPRNITSDVLLDGCVWGRAGRGLSAG